MLVAPDDGTRPIFDSHNVALWDGLAGQYVMYMRSWIPDPNSFRGGGIPVDTPEHVARTSWTGSLPGRSTWATPRRSTSTRTRASSTTAHPTFT